MDPFPSATLAADIILEKTTWKVDGVIPEVSWGVVEDVQPSKFKIQDLELHSLFKAGESGISNPEMRRRAIVLGGNLGLVDAKYLIAYQTEIPDEWQDCYIVFPGTVLRNSFTGDSYAAVLYATGISSWRLSFTYLNSDWYVDGCVVSIKQ